MSIEFNDTESFHHISNLQIHTAYPYRIYVATLDNGEPLQKRMWFDDPDGEGVRGYIEDIAKRGFWHHDNEFIPPHRITSAWFERIEEENDENIS